MLDFGILGIWVGFWEFGFFGVLEFGFWVIWILEI